MYRLFTVLVLTTLVFSIAHASTQLIYLEFNTATMDDLESRIVALESIGVRARHIFPPNAVFAEVLGSSLIAEAEQLQIIFEATSASVRGSASPSNHFAYSAYKHLASAAEDLVEKDDRMTRTFMNCINVVPDSIARQFPNKSPMTVNADMFTNIFLVGRVALKVILMESNGIAENWGSVQENRTIAEIVEATDWMAEQAKLRDVSLSWVYEINTQVPTTYEPIQEVKVPYYDLTPDPHWEFKWIDDARIHFGFPRDKWDGVFDMANDMRRTYHANWGFSVFVVMDQNDDDHMFPDGWFAYVSLYEDYLNAPWNACFVVMTYNNANWGYSDMDEVFRHETGHIFRAPDEYYNPESGRGCDTNDCSRGYGYLWEDNDNCEHCNPNSQQCIMRSDGGVDYYCPSSLIHLGWRDSDVDGVPDATKLNGGGWASIPNVTVGDLVRIYTLDFDLVNVHCATSDRIAERFLWDGRNYDGQAAVPGRYYCRINGGEPFQISLHASNPDVTPQLTGIAYANQHLNWQLQTSWAIVRCFILDSSDQVIARPIWDKLFDANSPQSTDIGFLTPERDYYARFYAWRPDGGASQVVNYNFFHPCTWLVGDANGNGVCDISDARYILNNIFEGGPVPTPHAVGSGDANCTGSVNISDSVYLIDYIFGGGPAPGLTCSCEDFY